MSTVQTAGHQAKNITTAATNQIVTGACVLKAIIINKALTGTITVIDGTSGSTSTHGVIAIGAGPIVITYDATMGTGIRIINSAAEDFTVIYRI